jgi:outer membrane protein assembly factor BamB
MKLLLLSLILAFSIYTVANAYAVENIPWPMFKHDPQHTGQSPFNGSEENTLRWRFPTDGRIQGSPVVGSDGTVYFGSHDSNLYAIGSDGKEKWHFPAKMNIDSTPAIAPDGIIFFGSWDMNLYAVAPSGEGMWRGQTHDRISSSPAIGSDGTIYFGADDKFLYASSHDGVQKWSFRTEDRIFSTPALASDGTIYAGSFDNNLYAINPDGTEKWRFKTNGFVFSSPSIAPDGTIYVGSYDRNVYAVYPNGTMKWSFPTKGVVQASPSIDPDGTIYIGSHDNNLYAINPDGTEKWRFTTGDLVVSSAAIDSDGTIYVGSVDTFLYAINPDGTEKWRFKTNARIFSSPAIGSDGTVYIGSVDGSLYAIGEPLEFNLPRTGSINERVGYIGTEMYVMSANVQANEVSIEVVIKNIDTSFRNFEPNSFTFIDAGGAEYKPDPEKSTLRNVRVQSNDVIRGTLFFKSNTAVELVYQDVRGVKLNVDLTKTKNPPDQVPVPWLMPGSNTGKKIIGDKLELTILDEKFLESDPQKYVIRISLKNKSTDEIKYDQSFAYIKDTDGNVYLPDTSSAFAGTLKQDQTVNGEIWFIVPSNVSSVAFVYDDLATNSYFVVPEFPLAIIAIIGAISLLAVLSRFSIQKM